MPVNYLNKPVRIDKVPCPYPELHVLNEVGEPDTYLIDLCHQINRGVCADNGYKIGTSIITQYGERFAVRKKDVWEQIDNTAIIYLAEVTHEKVMSHLHYQDPNFEKYRRQVLLKTICRKNKLPRKLDSYLKHEVDVAKRLTPHINIVSFYDCFSFPGIDYYVVEMCSGRFILDFMKPKGLEKKKIIPVFRDVVSGLNHIHSHGILHRRIKPDSILVLSNGTIKITDFGYACHVKDSTASDPNYCGTKYFELPSYLAKGPLNDPRAIDVYALGVTLYQFCHGPHRMPYEEVYYNYDIDEDYEEAKYDQIDIIFNKTLDTRLKRAVFMMINRRPADRPFIQDLLKYDSLLNPSIGTGITLCVPEKQILPREGPYHGSKWITPYKHGSLFIGDKINQDERAKYRWFGKPPKDFLDPKHVPTIPNWPIDYAIYRGGHDSNDTMTSHSSSYCEELAHLDDVSSVTPRSQAAPSPSEVIKASTLASLEEMWEKETKEESMKHSKKGSGTEYLSEYETDIKDSFEQGLTEHTGSQHSISLGLDGSKVLLAPPEKLNTTESLFDMKPKLRSTRACGIPHAYFGSDYHHFCMITPLHKIQKHCKIYTKKDAIFGYHPPKEPQPDVIDSSVEKPYHVKPQKKIPLHVQLAREKKAKEKAKLESQKLFPNILGAVSKQQKNKRVMTSF